MKTILPYWGISAAIMLSCRLLIAESVSEIHALKEVPLGNIQIHDNFWEPRLKTYIEKTIPHSWHYMQWEMRSLRKAAGQKVEGELNNTWGEANLYKFMESASYSLALRPDADLDRRLTEVIQLLAAGQQKDGYLHVYITNNKKTPWDPGFLDGSHDGYVLGHMIEAALAHHSATGRRDFLDIACKAADQACAHFLPPAGQPGFCGHAGLEMALASLYRVTHEKRYLALSRAFVEWRGRAFVKPFSATPRAYFQDEVPVRRQRTLEGHAVRAVFFATGVADLAIETGEGDYRLAANRFWDSTTLRRMTLTGSIGPRKEHEAIGEDYELPQDGYYESCAACGLANFAQRMFWLERRSECVDVLERTLYNAVLHGISLDGTNTYYCNPLSDRDHLRDNCWVCCPPNLSRTLLQAGRYAYAWNARDLYVNLFMGSTVRIPFPSGDRMFRIKTDYPWDGKVLLSVESGQAARFALHLRKPGWCDKAVLQINGAPGLARPDDTGYWVIDREWKKGDVVALNMEMPVQRMEAHPAVVACVGKTALQRGPLVYAFEGLDNNGNSRVVIGRDSVFTAAMSTNAPGGGMVIRSVSANGQPIMAIPFYALANRGKTSQDVWVEQKGLKPGTNWWLGSLYRAGP